MELGPRLLYERLKNIEINSVWEITDTDSIQNTAFSIQPVIITIGDNSRLLFINDEFIMLPYRNVTLFQDGLSIHIGTFETFVAINEEYKYMLYSNGTIDSYCKNGRSLKVYVQCYSELLIKTITEPIKCGYNMLILLPEICGVSMRVGDEFLGLETPSAIPNEKIFIPEQLSDTPNQTVSETPFTETPFTDTPRQTIQPTQTIQTIPPSYTPHITVTPTAHIIYIYPSVYNPNNTDNTYNTDNNTNIDMHISSPYLYSLFSVIGLITLLFCCCGCIFSKHNRTLSSTSIKYKTR